MITGKTLPFRCSNKISTALATIFDMTLKFFIVLKAMVSAIFSKNTGAQAQTILGLFYENINSSELCHQC